MQSRNNAAIYLDDEPAGGEVLQTAFLEAICQHRSLIGDMGATLRRLGTAIAQSNLDASEKSLLVAGIDEHVHSAKSIVASIDRALSIATVTPGTVRH